MRTLLQLSRKLEKDYGLSAAAIGGIAQVHDRLPFGVYDLDYALGGGLPRGRISCLWGPENQGKTLLALLAIKQFQELWPDQDVVFLDVEQSLDLAWAGLVGVDTKSILHLQPGWGEQAIDMLDMVYSLDNLGLIVIDSMASLVPKGVQDGDGDRRQVAGNTQLIASAMGKTLGMLFEARRRGKAPTVLALNQVRLKFTNQGAVEDMPGGFSLKHHLALSLAVRGKKKIVSTVDPDLPALLEATVRVKKYKVPVVQLAASYNMALLPTSSVSPGAVVSWPGFKQHMETAGWLTRGPKGKGYRLLDQEFKLERDLRAWLDTSPHEKYQIQQSLIEGALATKFGDTFQDGYVHVMGPEDVDEEEEDGDEAAETG